VSLWPHITSSNQKSRPHDDGRPDLNEKSSACPASIGIILDRSELFAGVAQVPVATGPVGTRGSSRTQKSAPLTSTMEVRVRRSTAAATRDGANDTHWTAEEPDPQRILVIAPGAGTRLNMPVYEALRHLGYLVEIIDYPLDWVITRNGYPPNWQNNTDLEPRGTNLAGLAAVVGEQALIGKPPAAIMCGSRGGQVTIGLVWRHYWRGPTVVINAGFLMTRTPLYRDVFPVMVSLASDYFETRDADLCIRRFQALPSAHRGVLIQLQDEHMPCDELEPEIENILFAALFRAGAAQCGEQLWSMQPLTRVWCLRKDAPEKLVWG
jgi:hypothetical protein